MLSDSHSGLTATDDEYEKFALPLIHAMPNIQRHLTDVEIVAIGKRLGEEAVDDLKHILFDAGQW